MAITDKPIFFVTLRAVVYCGLMAGLFFTFSTFAMRALAVLPVPQGIAAMQSINVTILNPGFFAVFFGATATSLFALVYALLHRNASGANFLLAGAICYLGALFW